MSKVTINGVDLELDLMDADVVEKFEDLNKWIVKKIQDPNAYEGLSKEKWDLTSHSITTT